MPICILVKIINDNNFIVDTFINIDSEEDITKLNKKLETVIPKSDISKKDDKKIIINFLKTSYYYINIIREIYKDDLKYLPV